jgi:hypothetical protein
LPSVFCMALISVTCYQIPFIPFSATRLQESCTRASLARGTILRSARFQRTSL